MNVTLRSKEQNCWCLWMAACVSADPQTKR